MTLDDWWTVAEVLQAHFDNPNWGIYASLLEYDICRRSIITGESIHMVQLYIMFDGTKRLRTPKEFYDLPVWYTDAVLLIDGEKRLIEKERHSAPK